MRRWLGASSSLHQAVVFTDVDALIHLSCNVLHYIKSLLSTAAIVCSLAHHRRQLVSLAVLSSLSWEAAVITVELTVPFLYLAQCS